MVSSPDVLDGVAKVEVHVLGYFNALDLGRMVGVMGRMVNRVVGHFLSFVGILGCAFLGLQGPIHKCANV